MAKQNDNSLWLAYCLAQHQLELTRAEQHVSQIADTGISKQDHQILSGKRMGFRNQVRGDSLESDMHDRQAPV